MSYNTRSGKNVTAELEARGAATFGSIERQKARLERFVQMEAAEHRAYIRNANMSLEELVNWYQVCCREGVTCVLNEIHSEILYQLQRCRREAEFEERCRRNC